MGTFRCQGPDWGPSQSDVHFWEHYKALLSFVVACPCHRHEDRRTLPKEHPWPWWQHHPGLALNTKLSTVCDLHYFLYLKYLWYPSKWFKILLESGRTVHWIKDCYIFWSISWNWEDLIRPRPARRLFICIQERGQCTLSLMKTKLWQWPIWWFWVPGWS